MNRHKRRKTKKAAKARERAALIRWIGKELQKAARPFRQAEPQAFTYIYTFTFTADP